MPISEVMVERALHELREEGLLVTVKHGRKGCQFLRPGDPIPKRLSIFLSHDEGDYDGQKDGVSVPPSLCEATTERIERKQPAPTPEDPDLEYQGQTEQEYISHRLDLRRKAISCAHSPAAYVAKLCEIFRAEFHKLAQAPKKRADRERIADWFAPYETFQKCKTA